MPTVHSSVLVGVDVVPLRLEAVCTPGFTGLHVLGLPADWARDARERARVALEALGQRLESHKIVVQITCDRSLRHARSAPNLLDFALCAAVLLALREARDGACARLEERLHQRPLHLVGELRLSGELGHAGAPLLCEAVCAVAPREHLLCLPQASSGGEPQLSARALRFPTLGAFAAWVARGLPHDDADLFAVSSQAYGTFDDERPFLQEHLRIVFPCLLDAWMRTPKLALSLIIALAGRLDLFVLGSPGIGKTHALGLARKLLPPLCARERIERRLICAGVAGEADDARRPFRVPQHTCTVAGLVGNASLAPGEFTLAHRGVLFLDEFLEFGRARLEALREPLERKQVHLARAQGSVALPADFQLLAAANPCRCGHFFSRVRACRCTSRERLAAWAPLSGPLLDRFALKLAVGEAAQQSVAPLEVRGTDGHSENDEGANPYLALLEEVRSHSGMFDAFLTRFVETLARSWGVDGTGVFGPLPGETALLSSFEDAELLPNLRSRKQWDAILRTADALFPEVARQLPVACRMEALAPLRDLERVLGRSLLYEGLPPDPVRQNLSRNPLKSPTGRSIHPTRASPAGAGTAPMQEE
jgi:magnesium chelatase family protein